MIFTTPKITEEWASVIAKIAAMRNQMRHVQGRPMRWYGTLRRDSLARAIQGSNSIEGYNVTEDDAVAAVEMEEPLDAKQETWMAISGYRDAMTYVLQLSQDAKFAFDEGYVRSLHFMMLKYDLKKHPGNWRLGPIWVKDDTEKRIVYTAPDREFVEPLMSELMEELRQPSDDLAAPDLVKAAMVHLNFVMIHPFADGNGRMARCLQTMVLSRQGIIEPMFCSVEEYLGQNTKSYYEILAQVGQGIWSPQNDARPWIEYMLHAHYVQASKLVWRMNSLERLWTELESYVEKNKLYDRMVGPLVDAARGYRIRNALYRKATEVSENLASRDLKVLSDIGMIDSRGEKRGRYYVATPALAAIRNKCYQPFRPGNPFAPENRTDYLPGMGP